MLQSTRDSILTLLKRIKDGAYPADSLDDTDALTDKIASDLGCDPSHAMAVLGYLIQQKYVEMDPEKGIVVRDRR